MDIRKPLHIFPRKKNPNCEAAYFEDHLLLLWWKRLLRNVCDFCIWWTGWDHLSQRTSSGRDFQGEQIFFLSVRQPCQASRSESEVPRADLARPARLMCWSRCVACPQPGIAAFAQLLVHLEGRFGETASNGVDMLVSCCRYPVGILKQPVNLDLPCIAYSVMHCKEFGPAPISYHIFVSFGNFTPLILNFWLCQEI